MDYVLLLALLSSSSSSASMSLDHPPCGGVPEGMPATYIPPNYTSWVLIGK